MDAVELMRMMSAQAAHDNPVPKPKLGFIDYDFNMSTYPQILPRVIIDGQGMSDRGYQCLNTYYPIPGDRVLMMQVGIAYVILGAVDRTNTGILYPGQLMFSITNENTTQDVAAIPGVNINWTNTDVYDPYGFWNGVDLSQVRPTIPGRYNISASVGFPTPPTGHRRISLQKNGSFTIGGTCRSADITGGSVRINRVRSYDANGTTDYFEVQAAISGSVSASGGNPNRFPSSGETSTLEFYYVGPPKLDARNTLD